MAHEYSVKYIINSQYRKYIEFVIIDGVKNDYIKEVCEEIHKNEEILAKNFLSSEFIKKPYVKEKKVWIDKLNDIMTEMFYSDKSELYFGSDLQIRVMFNKGLVHSYSEPAITSKIDAYEDEYFIHGNQYDYEDWVKNKEVRKTKIKKLLKND